MTSEKELRKIAAYEVEAACINTEIGILKLDYPELDDYELCRVHHLIVNWPIPDMPPSDYERTTAWDFDDISIEPGEDGRVLIDWDDDDDEGYGRVTRTLNLTPAQVQAIIAAHYHRKDQE
jgi:hypothetical protein